MKLELDSSNLKSIDDCHQLLQQSQKEKKENISGTGDFDQICVRMILS